MHNTEYRFCHQNIRTTASQTFMSAHDPPIFMTPQPLDPPQILSFATAQVLCIEYNDTMMKYIENDHYKYNHFTFNSVQCSGLSR